MPKRRRFQENTHYHVYNRGLYKQTLFHDNNDMQRFLLYIDRYKEKCKNDIQILAYCILPNHFHIVVKTLVKGHRLSYCIGNICAAYTRYYKCKYSVGKGKSFFESRFKAKEIDDTEYLEQCIYYVENNPLKHQLVEKSEDWIFRSTTSHNRACLPQAGANIEKLDWDREF